MLLFSPWLLHAGALYFEHSGVVNRMCTGFATRAHAYIARDSSLFPNVITGGAKNKLKFCQAFVDA